MALCKRMVKFAADSGICFTNFELSCLSKIDYRKLSQLVKSNGNRACLVDTLKLVRGLEAEGLPSKQAEAITAAITQVLNDSLENVANSFVSNAEMQKEHHFSLLQRETEKHRSDIEKLQSELRHEIDKVKAGQRLDLNLEKGRIRDELANQKAEITSLTSKLDNLADKQVQEIHALRAQVGAQVEAQVEAAKYDVMKYSLGTLVLSVFAVGLAIVRILR